MKNWRYFLILVIPAVMIGQLHDQITTINEWTNETRILFFTNPWSEIHLGRTMTRWVVNALATWSPFRILTSNLIIQTAAVWSTLIILWQTARRYTDDVIALTAPALGTIFMGWGLLLCNGAGNEPYDLPILLATALGVFMLIKGNFWPFFWALIIGSTVKESIIWLIPAWGLYRWKFSKKPSFKTAFWQALLLIIVFFAVYKLLRYQSYKAIIFYGATSDGVSTIKGNFYNMFMLPPYAMTNLGHNIWWPLTIHLTALSLWRRKLIPGVFKALYLAMPVYCIGIYIGGAYGELRLWNEIMPPGAICGTILFAHLIKKQK